MRIGFRAAGDVTGEITSSGDTILYEGLFSGDLEGYRVSDLRGRAVIAPEDVQLRGLSGTINGAGFEGRGQFDISRSDSVAFTLEGDVWDVDLAKGLVLGEDEMPVTDGRGRLRIEHTDLPIEQKRMMASERLEDWSGGVEASAAKVVGAAKLP